MSTTFDAREHDRAHSPDRPIQPRLSPAPTGEGTTHTGDEMRCTRTDIWRKHVASPVAAGVALHEPNHPEPRETPRRPRRGRNPRCDQGCPGVARGLSPTIIAREGRTLGTGDRRHPRRFTPGEIAHYRRQWAATGEE